MILWEKTMQQEITSTELDILRSRLNTEMNYIEVAKLQKELAEKEFIYEQQFRARLEQMEKEGSGIIGPK